MTRTLYLVGGLVALMLAFAAYSIVLSPPPGATAAVQAAAAHAASPTAPGDNATAIDDLAAWPVAAGR